MYCITQIVRFYDTSNTMLTKKLEMMKELIVKQNIVGFLLFGISIALSSCAAFRPVDVGLFVTDKKVDVSTEILDPVCGQTIESPQDELIWQFEGKSYYFYSSECLELFKKAPENYIERSPKEHHRTANNNAITWGFWGAAAGAMMLIMLL
jgi:YHS domain-containing protein